MLPNPLNEWPGAAETARTVSSHAKGPRMTTDTHSSTLTQHAATPIYSDYQWTQMRDVIVPLLLACPRKLIRYINHDVRQLFCGTGEPLFGDKRRGWLIEDYCEFITDMKTGRYRAEDALFSDMPRMAVLWGGGSEKRTSDFSELSAAALLSGLSITHQARAAFEDEFQRWLSYTDKAHDYDGWTR